MNYSSEIELAIKLGKAVYKPTDHESVELLKTLAKLDIDLTKFPSRDSMLSNDLRTLIQHQGDVSLVKFINDTLTTISQNITKQDEWAIKYYNDRLKYFLRGILYLYPAYSFSNMLRYEVIENFPCGKTLDAIQQYCAE